MKANFAKLNQRIQAVDTEVAVAQRTRSAKATEAFASLRDLTEQQIEMAARIAPEIRIVVGYTKEQLFNNENGEEAVLDKVITDLVSYVENRLTYWESLL